MATRPGSRRSARRRGRKVRALPIHGNLIADALTRLCGDLSRLRVPFALVGGLAVSAIAEPRLTRDVDVAVAVDSEAQAERLLHTLSGRGYTVVGSVEQTATGRLATARLLARTAPGIVVDLLFASSGVEQEVARLARPLELLPGLTVPVARVGHLLALKVLARDDRRRPQDLDDLRALMREARQSDLRLARKTLDLIRARGFNRRRDLVGAWNRLLRAKTT